MEHKLKTLEIISKGGKDIALSNLYKFEVNNEYADNLGMKFHEIMKFSFNLFIRLYKCKDILKTIDKNLVNDMVVPRCKIMLNVLKVYRRKLGTTYPTNDFDNKIAELSLFYDKLFEDLKECDRCEL